MTDSLLSAFAASVRAHGPKTALVEPDGTHVSFAELGARAEGFAAGWSAKGLGKGDRVLVAMPISADLYATLAALWSLGAVAVLPEPAMGLRGVRHALQLAPCKGLAAKEPYTWLRWLLPGLWTKPVFRPRVGPGKVPDHYPQGDEIALISFTSGSTGLPKAIARSHAFLQAQEAAIAPLLTSDADEIDLVAFPVFALINLAIGRTSVLPNWRMSRPGEVTPIELASWIEAQGVTRALLPPALCEALANARPLPGLSTVFTGGGPVFPDLVERLQATRSKLRVVAVYGSTEAEPIAHMDARDISSEDRKAMATGSGLLAGRPVPEVSIRIQDGEILVAGDHVNEGYLDPTRDAETKIKEDGVTWHRTGDAGRLDDAGRLWLLGRRGADVDGVYPFEIEAAARLWPGVKRVALAKEGGRAVLAIEGDAGQIADWTERAAEQFKITDVRHLATIPLDRRHGSKVDYPALTRALRRA